MTLATLPRAGFLPAEFDNILEVLLNTAANSSLHPLTISAYVQLLTKPPGWKPSRNGIATLLRLTPRSRHLRTVMAELYSNGFLSKEIVYDSKKKRAYGSRLFFHPLGDGASRTHTHITVSRSIGPSGFPTKVETAFCKHGNEGTCTICDPKT